MSDTNLGTNSSIELSDIRKLDILLTQCESSSCENICIDCCAKLGSLDDDDDDENNDENGSGISGMQISSLFSKKYKLSLAHDIHYFVCFLFSSTCSVYTK